MPGDTLTEGLMPEVVDADDMILVPVVEQLVLSDEDEQCCFLCGEVEELYSNQFDEFLRCSECHESFLALENDDSQDEDYGSYTDIEDLTDIHFYSYKPKDVIFHSYEMGDNSPPYVDGVREVSFGMELETTIRNGTMDDIQDQVYFVHGTMMRHGFCHESLVYLKEDGSLNNRGFEIVTHPMTLDFAMNGFPWEVIEGLGRHDFEAWDNPKCGLHFHLCRDAFTGDAHLFKFIKFIYANRESLVQFAGRESESYASFDIDNFINHVADRETGFYYRSSLAKMIKDKRHNNHRNCAVNLGNEKTVELRFFRPSLRPDTVKAAIQMCHAIFYYSELLTARDALSNRGFEFVSFRKWVHGHLGTYDLLDERIMMRCGARENGDM